MTDLYAGQSARETTQPVLDAAAIARNPEAYGFSWEYRALNKGRDQKTLLREHVPHFVVSDAQYPKFAANFHKAVMASINGTSVVIRGQNVARPAIKANPRITDTQLAEHLVRSVLLNVITRGGSQRVIYVGADGKQYTNVADAMASGQTVALTSPAQLAAQFMADAIDMGVEPGIARLKALEKWPDAFNAPADDDDDDEEAEETETATVAE